MLAIDSPQLGILEFEESDIVTFPAGLPAFEEQRRFLLLDREGLAPFRFLQSVDRPDLMLVTVPVAAVAPGYHLEAPPEDLERIGLAAWSQPAAGEDVECLAVVTLPEDGPATANLVAPILVNWERRLAAQVIQPEAGYSYAHPLWTAAEQVREC